MAGKEGVEKVQMVGVSKDSNNNAQQLTPVDVNNLGRLASDPKSFLIEVGLNNVAGYRLISFNGANKNLDPADGDRLIWRVKADYNFQTSAAALFAVSSDNTDTQTLAITYLDENHVEVLTTVTLTGQTPVQFTATTGIRVNACQVLGSVRALGNISLMVGTAVTAGVPDSTDDIVGNVPAFTQRLNQSLFTVPAGKIGVVISCLVSVDRAGDADINTHVLHPTLFPDTIITEIGLFQNTEQINFEAFILLEKTDAFITASTITNNSRVSLRCLFLLVDTDLANLA